MDNEEIQGVKFSEFPSATPGDSDEVVGLHAGDNARFSVANFILAIRQGLANIFVPLTRTINGKALNNDISLNASDVGAVPTSAVGAADGVASLDSNAKVPGTQLDLSNTQNKITASGILKGDGAGGVSAATPGTDYQAPLTAGTDYATPAQLEDKANPGQIGYPETGTTASRNYTAGEYICWNGLSYTANQAISSGTTLSAGTGGNLTECVGGGLNNLFTKTPKYTHFEMVYEGSVDHLIKTETSVIVITNNPTHTTRGSSLYYGIVSATNAIYSNLIEVQRSSDRPTTVTAGAGKITITTTMTNIHVVIIECPT